MPPPSTHSAAPICAPATAPFPSAVALLRLSGPNLAEHLRSFLELPPPRLASLRTLRWDGFEEQALVLFFPAPKSYTGEDVVELQIHGNPLLVQKLTHHLGTLGIRLAEAGEFTRRALLNAKQGLLKVEALGDLIAAETDSQIRMAQARAGAQPPWIIEVRQWLAPWMARAEAAVDYGEDDGILLNIEDLIISAQSMISLFHVEQQRANAARHLRDGIRVALVGAPNAGKSTLFNALIGEDRAIVTEVPGTTRDVLEARCEWRGLPLRVFDTAGLRLAEDPVERIGVARVAAVMAGADVVLHMVPCEQDNEDEVLASALRPFRAKTLVIQTFGDVRAPVDSICISALTGDLDALDHALHERVLGGMAPDACLGALANGRQVDLLNELVHQFELIGSLPSDAPPELPASLLQGAWGLLARLTGEDRADSALDEVFKGFCLGK